MSEYEHPDDVYEEQDPAVTAALRGVTSRAEGLRHRHHAQMRVLDPSTGSTAASDFAIEMGDLAHDHAVAAISSMLDHLELWRRVTHSGYVPAFAHMTVLRNAIESAVNALWLLEEGVSSEDRRHRGLHAAIDDVTERAKFEASIGVTDEHFEAPAKSGAQRREEFLDRAEGFDLVVEDERGRRRLQGALPSTVDLLDRYSYPLWGDTTTGQWLYRLTSGYGHAKQWAIISGAEVVAETEPTGTTDRSRAKVTHGDKAGVAVTLAAFTLAEAAVSRVEAYRATRI